MSANDPKQTLPTSRWTDRQCQRSFRYSLARLDYVIGLTGDNAEAAVILSSSVLREIGLRMYPLISRRSSASGDRCWGQRG